MLHAQRMSICRSVLLQCQSNGFNTPSTYGKVKTCKNAALKSNGTGLSTK